MAFGVVYAAGEIGGSAPFFVGSFLQNNFGESSARIMFNVCTCCLHVGLSRLSCIAGVFVWANEPRFPDPRSFRCLRGQELCL